MRWERSSGTVLMSNDDARRRLVVEHERRCRPQAWYHLKSNRTLGGKNNGSNDLFTLSLRRHAIHGHSANAEGYEC